MNAFDLDPVPGHPIGPALERVIYVSPLHRDVEWKFFGAIMAGILRSFPGEYEDIPECFREEANDQLIGNISN